MPTMHKLVVSMMGMLLAMACSGKSSDGVHAPFFPQFDSQKIKLPGLKNRVEILVDKQGVPHIFALSEADALFAQGYITARDRFFQMEFIRKAAAGRISELLGKLDAEATTENDLEVRRIMMTPRGTMIYDELASVLSLAEQELIRAYTAGINAWIEDAKHARNGMKPPVEYEKNPFIKSQGLKFADVAAWTAADSFAIGRYQQWNLSGSLGDELYIGRLRAKLPPAFFAETYRFEPADRTVSVENFFSTPPPFSGLTALAMMGQTTPEEERAYAHQLRETLERWRNPGRRYASGWPGSNNWVVGPKLTGGAAMLANDPHMRIFNPPIFYHTHLNTVRFGNGKWNTIGVTFPGVPGLLIGHNDYLAWGVTTLGYDVTDLYREEYADGSVRFKGGQVKVEYAKQKIRFGQGSNSTEKEFSLPYVPHHGPVVSGEEVLAGDSSKQLITMKWTGRELTADFRAFFNLLAARGIDDFFRAVHYFDVGAQSFVGADVDGNIGFFGHALVPVRPWDLQAMTPDQPMPGTGEYEWAGWLSDDKLVQAKNPEKGYIATANNDIVGTTLDNNPFNDPQYYWYLQDLGFRVRRISELIEDRRQQRNGPVTLEVMEAIQNDTYSLEGERVVPRLLDLIRGATVTDPRVQTAIQYLRDWTFGTPTGVESPLRKNPPSEEEKRQAVAVSIYYVLQDILIRRLMLDDYQQYGEGVPGWQQGSKFLIYALENTPATNHWFDDVSSANVTELPQQVVLDALAETLTKLETDMKTADISQWQWGRLHRVEGRDMVAQATGKSFDTNGPVAVDGSQFTVDPADYDGEYLVHSGPQIRFVVELKKGAIVSRSIIPGGQVADLGSPHKADQWSAWVNNERLPYFFYAKDIEANVEQRIELLPR